MELARADRYVKGLFDASPGHALAFGFREKYAHTQRVVLWVRRLLKTERADEDVLLMAATFHDAGYAVSPADHPARGAELCERYLRENGCGAEFASRVADCVRRHADKSLLRNPAAPKELVLLIEADCLDETGRCPSCATRSPRARAEGITGGRTSGSSGGASSQSPGNSPASPGPRAKSGRKSRDCTSNS